jgi:hypothetical protein
LGLVPDGVARVAIDWTGGVAAEATVRDNFFDVTAPKVDEERQPLREPQPVGEARWFGDQGRLIGRRG